jgi:hypothetical protein
MPEHERMTHGEKEKADQRHRAKQQEPQPVFDLSYEKDQSPLLFNETPFHPRMDEHAAILLRIPFTAQRHDFILRLNETYGSRYVQRLMESMTIQAKLTVNAPNDIYEQEADRVAEEVQEEEEEPVMPVLQRQEEEEEPIMPVLQRQSEEEEPVQAKVTLETQRQELPEEELQAQLAKPQQSPIT